MTVLVIAEHDNAALLAPTLHAIGAARLCGDDLHVLVAGHGCERAAHHASRIDGVTRVLLADAPQFEGFGAENLAALALREVRRAPCTHVLAAASAFGKNLMPRIAAGLDAGQVSDVIRIVAPDTFERPIYAGNAIATVRSLDRVKVLTVRAVSFGAAREGSATAEVEVVASVPDAGGARVLARERPSSGRPDLAAARIVVAGGRGLGSAENFRLLEPLADALGAAIGASRAAVDAGFVANELQIGQTGRIVAPALYIAVGISGAIQHLAGIGDARVIVAINNDADAPIFGVADVGIVGDLFEVVPALVDALS